MIATTALDVLRHGWHDAAITLAPDVPEAADLLEARLEMVVAAGGLDEAHLLAAIEDVESITARAGAPSGEALARRLRRNVYEYLLALDATPPVQAVRLQVETAPSHVDGRMVGAEEVAALAGAANAATTGRTDGSSELGRAADASPSAAGGEPDQPSAAAPQRRRFGLRRRHYGADREVAEWTTAELAAAKTTDIEAARAAAAAADAAAQLQDAPAAEAAPPAAVAPVVVAPRAGFHIVEDTHPTHVPGRGDAPPMEMPPFAADDARDAAAEEAARIAAADEEASRRAAEEAAARRAAGEEAARVAATERAERLAAAQKEAARVAATERAERLAAAQKEAARIAAAEEEAARAAAEEAAQVAAEEAARVAAEEAALAAAAEAARVAAEGAARIAAAEAARAAAEEAARAAAEEAARAAAEEAARVAAAEEAARIAAAEEAARLAAEEAAHAAAEEAARIAAEEVARLAAEQAARIAAEEAAQAAADVAARLAAEEAAHAAAEEAARIATEAATRIAAAEAARAAAVAAAEAAAQEYARITAEESVQIAAAEAAAQIAADQVTESGWRVRGGRDQAPIDPDLSAATVPDDPLDTDLRLVAIRRRVDDRLRRKRCDEAAALLQELAQETGGRGVAEFAMNAGDRCRALGKPNAALNCYLAASRADPVYELALSRLADICIDDQDSDLAVSYLERIARLNRLRSDDRAALHVYRRIATIAPYREDIIAILMNAQNTGRFES